jgi:hypothetical protein
MGSQPFKTYDATDVHIVFGEIILGGYGDGTFVTVTPQAQGFESYAGSDGTVARSAVNDPRKTVTVQLVQTSETHKLLQAHKNFDALTKKGVVPWFMTSKSDGYKGAGLRSWIQGDPEKTYARGVEVWEWTFEIEKMVEVFA